jgi:hypothetical protein
VGRAVAAARAVAARVADPELVAAANAAAATQTAFPEVMHWEPLSIAQGDAGLALAFGYLDACFPGEGWDATAHEYLTSAVEAAEHEPLQAGIFGGVSGLAFAAWTLSRDGARYERLLATLDAAVAEQAVVAARHLSARGPGVPVSDFDVISGLSGVGAYLLCRRGDPALAAALDVVLEALVALTAADDEPPPWHTPLHMMGDDSTRDFYPDGNLNCGLAHGIPGPLALMALSLTAGAAVEGLAHAVRRTSDWLVAHRLDDRWGINWPAAVPISPTGWEEPTRSAWCYGSPGVARSLWHAGRALRDEGLLQLAVDAMTAVYERPIPERRIDSPTFCHGIAGLLQISLRFANDTKLPMFSRAAADLIEQILESYMPERLLGFASVEPDGRLVDQAGFLDGAPGVVVVLVAAAARVEPRWDRLFLLS